MKYFKYTFCLFILLVSVKISGQEEQPILYFQMEPLDDSLFIEIQTDLYIDPPDPKAEMIVDLRDKNNQTISIKNVLYPLLALPPEIRARIVTYPFKIDLEEQTHFASVFTDVIEKIKFNKVFEPPSKFQISSMMSYVSPFFQLFGGERLGAPLKKDLGFSFGLGTPYSGPFETNFIEFNFHILGLKVGAISTIDAFTIIKDFESHNNFYAAMAAQVGYVLPFGNFFEVSYVTILSELSKSQLDIFVNRNSVIDSVKGIYYSPHYMKGSYVNWEFRYPFKTMGSTRAKLYVANYMDEWHFGFTGRELSLAGSTFDLRFDAMPLTEHRNPQYVIDIMIQKIAESWAFSAIAIGPSIIFSKMSGGSFGVTSGMLNFRMKLGTSF